MQEPITYPVLYHCFFQFAGVDDSITDPPGFVKDGNGHLTGQLFERPALTEIIENAQKPSFVEMLRAIEEQLKDYASRGLTTVTDISFTMKSDDPEMIIMLNKLKNVYESEPGLSRLAMYRLVHGPDESNSNSKPNAMSCPSLLRFDGCKVEFNI